MLNKQEIARFNLMRKCPRFYKEIERYRGVGTYQAYEKAKKALLLHTAVDPKEVLEDLSHFVNV